MKLFHSNFDRDGLLAFLVLFAPGGSSRSGDLDFYCVSAALFQSLLYGDVAGLFTVVLIRFIDNVH